MGWGRAAGALIAVLISCALIDVARGGDLVECEPQRVTGGYWAYRIIDGRECWYQGRPGKPKNELFWPGAPSAPQPMDQPEAETKTEPPDPSSRLVAAPPEKPETIEAMPETAANQLLAFTCCWPELEEPAPLPQPTQEPQAWLLALLSSYIRCGRSSTYFTTTRKIWSIVDPAGRQLPGLTRAIPVTPTPAAGVVLPRPRSDDMTTPRHELVCRKVGRLGSRRRGPDGAGH
jgi:hypothetical protein